MQRKHGKENEEMKWVFISSRKPNVWEESGKNVATRPTRVKQVVTELKELGSQGPRFSQEVEARKCESEGVIDDVTFEEKCHDYNDVTSN